MKKFLLSIVILVMNFSVSAQNFDKEFGVISEEEIALTEYEKDPDAEAVVLFDVGESFFNETDNGYDIRMVRTRRMKILKQSGTNFAEMAIPFYVDGYGATEKVKSIEAFTYNVENGQPVKKALDQSTIYEEQLSNNWRVKKFAFPDVKEGSIVEVKYVLETPFLFNLPDWKFQNVIPTVYSQYTVRMIPFYEYIFLAKGIKQFDYHNSTVSEQKRKETVGVIGVEFRESINTYAMKDIPAFNDETFMASPNDYIMQLDFQLSKITYLRDRTREVIPTWDVLKEEFLDSDNFGKYVKDGSKLAKKIFKDELIVEGMNETEKIKTIIDYVKTNFKWNETIRLYASKSAKEFLAHKTGSSAEMNLFLTAMLQEAEIDAHPVILSTRSNGKFSIDYPLVQQFNNVAVIINGENPILTDATDPFLAFNRIPVYSLNGKGLVIDKGNLQWVLLENNSPSIENHTIFIDVDTETLTANAEIFIQNTEYSSQEYKEFFNNDESNLTEYFETKELTDIEGIKTYNYDKAESPYAVAFKAKSEILKLKDKIIVTPFLNFPLKENILKKDERRYPIDFVYPKIEAFSSTVNIPEGYKISSIPESFEDNFISYKVSQDEEKIILKAEFKLAAEYEAKDYKKLKAIFNKMISRFNEQIVFEPI
ncbi:MAG TPA: DUF3857 domain-containing protein [Salinimicrobium sp.]|nr:DUF3857 domain-containing protein [Salinimicrobium sp.]